MKETSMRYMTIQVERLFIFNLLSLQDGKRRNKKIISTGKDSNYSE